MAFYISFYCVTIRGFEFLNWYCIKVSNSGNVAALLRSIRFWASIIKAYSHIVEAIYQIRLLFKNIGHTFCADFLYQNAEKEAVVNCS